MPKLSEFLLLDRFISSEYALAVVVFIISLVILRLVFTVAQKILLALTKKTKTDADDIIIQKSSVPLTILSLVLSLRVTILEVTLSQFLDDTFANILYSGVVIVIGYLTFVIVDVGLIRGWTHLSKRTKVELDENLTSLLHGMLKIVLIVLATLYILDLWGVAIGPLLGALGIAGLAVALALQPTLSNIFSGVSMIVDKSVRVGDWVILEDGAWGIVEKVGIRSTKFRTFDNEMLVIPNTKFADSRIQNVSMPDPKARVVVPFGVAYGSDIDKVKKVVEKEIKKIKNIDKNEDISVKFLEMADSSLNFKVYFYVETFEVRLGAIDEANTRIYNALNKEGIAIPFPQMDVHLKKD